MPYARVRTPVGARRQRIEIQSLDTTDDGMGGQVAASSVGWRTIGRAWAKVDALDERQREALMAGRELTSLHAYHMDIAYRTGVEPQMRVQWRDQTLEIQTAVDDTGEKKRLILLCSEVQGVTASA